MKTQEEMYLKDKIEEIKCLHEKCDCSNRGGKKPDGSPCIHYLVHAKNAVLVKLSL